MISNEIKNAPNKAGKKGTVEYGRVMKRPFKLAWPIQIVRKEGWKTW